MKKTISLVRVCALTLVMLICLAGCRADASAPPEEKAAVCYVLANTACSQGLNLSSPWCRTPSTTRSATTATSPW